MPTKLTYSNFTLNAIHTNDCHAGFTYPSKVSWFKVSAISETVAISKYRFKIKMQSTYLCNCIFIALYHPPYVGHQMEIENVQSSISKYVYYRTNSTTKNIMWAATYGTLLSKLYLSRITLILKHLNFTFDHISFYQIPFQNYCYVSKVNPFKTSELIIICFLWK